MSEITPNTPNPVREDSYTTELATKLGIDPKNIPKSPVWRNEEELAAIAEMFSNMAGGSSGGGVLVVHVDTDTYTLDKTWKEMHDSSFCVIKMSSSSSIVYAYVNNILKYNSEYIVVATMGGESASFTTNSADGYPVKE